MDLSTKFLGIKIRNPIIVGSSGLSNSLDGIKKLEDNNAGAVILKSLFEEQIINEGKTIVDKNVYEHPDAYDYIKNYTKQNSVEKYLNLIEKAKDAIDIPVIASINCVSSEEWIDFADQIEKVGADGLELNVSFLPSADNVTGNENEKLYFDITEKLRSVINIPIALKMSYYSSGLANLIKRLSWTGFIDSFILFNRYYNPDINIDKIEIVPSNVLSNPEDISVSLRWIALLSRIIETDLVPSTGIHDANGVIKQILAGAGSVQIVSTLYKNGAEYINNIIQELSEWMKSHEFASIDDFKGKIHDLMPENNMFERVQYMKYYGGIS